MTDLHEIAEHMRRMGEHEDSIRYALGEIPQPRPSLLEMFGQVLDPRGLTMERAVAVMEPYSGPMTAKEATETYRAVLDRADRLINPPAIETGD